MLPHHAAEQGPGWWGMVFTLVFDAMLLASLLFGYVYLLAAILAIDATTAIPFAKIRLDNKPKKFAGIRMANILVYVFFNFCIF